jgi:hypothetical protein
MARPARAASVAPGDGGATPAPPETRDGAVTAAAPTGPRRDPSGHTFDETESRCLTCGWQFRRVEVSTGKARVDPVSGVTHGVDSSLPAHQYRHDDDDTWRSIWQPTAVPPRWPPCPKPAPVVEDLES